MKRQIPTNLDTNLDTNLNTNLNTSPSPLIALYFRNTFLAAGILNAVINIFHFAGTHGFCGKTAPPVAKPPSPWYPNVDTFDDLFAAIQTEIALVARIWQRTSPFARCISFENSSLRPSLPGSAPITRGNVRRLYQSIWTSLQAYDPWPPKNRIAWHRSTGNRYDPPFTT